MTLWHYTVGAHLQEIIEDGEIRPAIAHVPKGEKPIVWFSLNQKWERTANKSWRNSDGTQRHLDMAETSQLCGGLVRIGASAEVAPHDWKALRELSGMSSGMAAGLYRTAIERGARPGEWRGAFEAVPRLKWTAVEVFHDGAWVAVPFETKAREREGNK